MGVVKKVKKSLKKAGKAATKFAEGKTGNKLIDVGTMALSGDVYGLQQEGFKQLGKAIGKKNLVKAQNFGEKTLGKKNYQVTARGVKRGNRIGANAASAYLAYARGDPLTATKYGGDVAEAAIGTKALRQAHGAVKKAVGEKNYDLAMQGYKGARHGVTLGYNLAHLKHMDDAANVDRSVKNMAKLGLAGVHVVSAAEKAHGYIENLKREANQGKQMQSPQASKVRTMQAPIKSAAVGKGGIKPKLQY
jgi:hypothetical protein